MEKISPLKRALLVLLLTLPLGIAGCNTMEGLGKDIQKGGQAIERIGQK